MINRRTVLIASASTVGLSLSVLGIGYGANTPEKIIENIVRVRLPKLEMTQADMTAFVSDFIESDTDTSALEMSVFRVMAPFVNLPPFRWMLPGKATRTIENFHQRVLTEFMMGSDFFETYAEGNPKVSYTGLFDPYQKPCGNPLPPLFEDV